MNDLGRLGLGRLCAQVSGICETVGTPLYVYDWSSLRRITEVLLGEADRAGVGPHVRFYLAMFALPNLFILQRLLRLDKRLGLACNTPEEIHALQESGFSEWDRTVFSGGVLTFSQLREVAATGTLVHASSVGNVEKLAALPEPTRIGLRLDLYNNALKGIRVEEIGHCIRLLQRKGKSVCGLHAYPGTQVSNPDVLTRHVELLLERTAEMQGLKEVNFGGGFHYNYEGRTGEFHLGEKLAEYFRTVRYQAETWLTENNGWLAWEPGRLVFAASGFFVTEIVEVRFAGIASANYYVDGSFTQMPAPKLLGRQHHAVVLTSEGEVKRGPLMQVRICGATTLSTDQLLPGDCLLPTAEPGDLLVIFDMGAYGRAGAYSFLGKALPPEVLIEEHGWRVVRQRQEPNYHAGGFVTDEVQWQDSPSVSGCPRI